MGQTDYQDHNVAYWQQASADYVETAERNWRTGVVEWGIWRIPNQDMPLFPEDLSGMDCLEVGCGAGYVSGWIAARGGRATGIDPTPNQLATATRMNRELKRGVHFVQGFGEQLPFPDLSFDFAISEYGASLWADPYRWIPEIARVLRPGGQLVFMTCHALFQICVRDVEEGAMTTSLQRSYLGLHRLDWTDPPSVEFSLPHGAWIKLLRENGFEIESLLEAGAPLNASSRYKWADPEWAQSWPTEEIWKARKK